MIYRSITRGIAAFGLILAVSLLTFADTVRLKNGSIIKGKIVKFGGGKFTVAMGEGARRREMAFTAAEVESIQFDTNPAPTLSNRNASYEQPKPEVIPAKIIKADDEATRRSTRTEPMKAIEWKVKVLADNTANGWTNSGWVVRKGQRIRISGDGKVNLGRGNSSPSSGLPNLDDPQKLLKNVATGALIAVIGDDNNDFIYVGSEREFVATRDGALFLGINEGYLEDNSGSFSVKIEILPDDAE